MPISFIRYIDVTSSEGGVSEIPTRALITRIFTTNPLLPPQSHIEFETAAQVGAYFGTAGEEYARASAYFEWISKQGTSPEQISFSRWDATAQPPVVYGDPLATATLASFTAITAGTLNVTIGGTNANLTAINLSADASLAAVAATIQTALAAVITGATVAYNTTTGAFVLTGPAADDVVGDTIVFNSGTLVTPLGFASPNTIFGQGSPVETITQTLTTSAQLSTNFGSFLFLTESNPLTLTQYEQAASWNAANENNDFILLVPVTAANAAAWSVGLAQYEGTALTLVGSTSDFAEMLPGKVLAATNYNAPNASQNYMFQQDASLVPTVTTDAQANIYDPLRVNYYGQTQQNGQFINFYQRGLLMGSLANAPTSMTVYANEIWFKGTVEASLGNLLLSVPEVPANSAGRVLILSNLQAAIQAALANGVISTGNVLTTAQKQYIQSITGDATVAAQIQAIGYWINITFSSYVDSAGATEWQANYQIIYAQSNAVNVINGTHNLI